MTREDLHLGKRILMLGADLTMDLIEFVVDPSNTERDQVPQSTPPQKG